MRVGGDFQGRNLAVVNAATVTMTPATMLRADALESGDGGRVVVWAAANNDFQGVVSARGGAAGGAGGAIEVSSQGSLSYAGSADAGAPSGQNGTLLLDPKNLIISAAPVGVFPHVELTDPHPTPGGGFGTGVVPLSNGNIVVTNPNDEFGSSAAGAVYLFNGLTGAFLSSLVGNNVSDHVGSKGVMPLANGNYVVLSPTWNSSSGAATWGDGLTGTRGIISEANSLVPIIQTGLER